METLWTWLAQHYGVVSALASVATLCVWIAYLHLFYRSYRHQLRPKILITRGGGHALKSRCILTNMSPEMVFIQAVIVGLKVDDTDWLCSLSDVDKGSREGRDPRSEFFQGPLASGEYLDLGPFEDLAAAAIQNCDGVGAIEQLQEMTVTAIGSYPWHDRLVAAERSFTVHGGPGQRLLHADQPTARQIRSRRELHRIERLLREQSYRSILRPD